MPYEHNWSSYFVASNIRGSVLHRQSYKQKEIAPHCPKSGAITYIIILRANRSHIRLPLNRLYTRVVEKSTTLFKTAFLSFLIKKYWYNNYSFLVTIPNDITNAEHINTI